jgi:hypothetical protein
MIWQIHYSQLSATLCSCSGKKTRPSSSYHCTEVSSRKKVKCKSWLDGASWLLNPGRFSRQVGIGEANLLSSVNLVRRCIDRCSQNLIFLQVVRCSQSSRKKTITVACLANCHGLLQKQHLNSQARASRHQHWISDLERELIFNSVFSHININDDTYNSTINQPRPSSKKD